MPITREVRSPRTTDLDLNRLSPAERLFLWRHRQPSTTRPSPTGRGGSAMTQREAAKLLGVSLAAYNKLENELRTLLSVADVEPLLVAINHLVPTDGELCLLARRRSGRVLSQIEVESRICRPRFLDLERRGDDAIIGFWRARGFVFPPRTADKAA